MTAAYKLCYLLAAYGIVVTQRQVLQIFNVTLRALDRRKIQTGNSEAFALGETDNVIDNLLMHGSITYNALLADIFLACFKLRLD